MPDASNTNPNFVGPLWLDKPVVVPPNPNNLGNAVNEAVKEGVTQLGQPLIQGLAVISNGGK